METVRFSRRFLYNADRKDEGCPQAPSEPSSCLCLVRLRLSRKFRRGYLNDRHLTRIEFR